MDVAAFGTVPLSVALNAKLSAADKALYTYLAARHCRSKPFCWPSLEGMMEGTKRPRRGIQTSLARLASHKAIVRIQRGRRGPPIIVLVHDPRFTPELHWPQINAMCGKPVAELPHYSLKGVDFQHVKGVDYRHPKERKGKREIKERSR